MCGRQGGERSVSRVFLSSGNRETRHLDKAFTHQGRHYSHGTGGAQSGCIQKREENETAWGQPAVNWLPSRGVAIAVEVASTCLSRLALWHWEKSAPSPRCHLLLLFSARCTEWRSGRQNWTRHITRTPTGRATELNSPHHSHSGSAEMHTWFYPLPWERNVSKLKL